MALVRLFLVLAVVVVAAVATNVVLLSVATGGGEPVGRLSPVVAAHGPTTGSGTKAPRPRPPAQEPHEDD